MHVKLLAKTKLIDESPYLDTQAVSLTAIRTCYSPLSPTEILDVEGDKYFKADAKDGQGGSDAERLFRHITRSGHTSTLEHVTYTFCVEGVSRSLLAQLTRHRVGFSFSVQSQRYVRSDSTGKMGGFSYITPPKIAKNDTIHELYNQYMDTIQELYDELRKNRVPPEDARMILPNAATCNMVMTANLRALLDFYAKRQKGRGAQWEIADLAEEIRKVVVDSDPWLDRFFEEV